jgi:hypothetical protein
MLQAMNRDNMDDVGSAGGEQGMKVLSEMNELWQAQDQIIRDGMLTISVL